MSAGAFHIAPARIGADLAAVTSLFEAYAASLEIELTYQDFEAELARLPGEYAPPKGRLLLARAPRGEPLGCVALRPLSTPGCCEMKRLFVTPESRGMGLGRALVQAIVGEARTIGYGEMRLDTLPTMAAAQAMYREAGFRPIPPYYQTPIAGTVFLGLTLSANPD